MKHAILECGYRHIDTAKVYFNEEKIGKTIKECLDTGKVKREELFITTKLYQTADKLDVEQALREALQRLQLEYLDLYLIHWMLPYLDWDSEDVVKPTPMYKVWAEMERMVEIGLVKSIGVSNCSIPMFFDILTYAKIKPAVNQIEVHPYLAQI